MRTNRAKHFPTVRKPPPIDANSRWRIASGCPDSFRSLRPQNIESEIVNIDHLLDSDPRNDARNRENLRFTITREWRNSGRSDFSESEISAEVSFRMACLTSPEQTLWQAQRNRQTIMTTLLELAEPHELSAVLAAMRGPSL